MSEGYEAMAGASGLAASAPVVARPQTRSVRARRSGSTPRAMGERRLQGFELGRGQELQHLGLVGAVPAAPEHAQGGPQPGNVRALAAVVRLLRRPLLVLIAISTNSY